MLPANPPVSAVFAATHVGLVLGLVALGAFVVLLGATLVMHRREQHSTRIAVKTGEEESGSADTTKVRARA